MSEANIYPSLRGRPVVITGAGTGIGKAMALAFARQAAPVGIIDLNPEAAAQVVQEIEASGGTAAWAAADVTQLDTLRQAFSTLVDRHGPVRVLVNNAGNDQRHDFSEITPDYWDEKMAVNLRHLAFASQLAVPGMRAAGGGVIINMGSTSWMQGAERIVAYGTAKAAIAGFTQCLAHDLGVDGIRVMCIAPGRTMTERLESKGYSQDFFEESIKRQAVKFFIQSYDIANIALWLASDDARMMSGQTIVADGGHMMR